MTTNRILLITILIMVSLGAILTILQLWGIGIGWSTYVKLIATLGILTLLTAFIMILKADLGDHKKMKDENYLD